MTRVDFYVNGFRQCSIKMAPYVCAWRVPVTEGKSYRLRAEAYDTSGNVGVSPVVTLTAQ